MSEEEKKYHDYLNQEGASDGLDPEIADFLNKSSNIQVPKSTRSKTDIWNAIDKAADEEPDESNTKTISVNLWQIISVAAVIALLILAIPRFLSEKKNEPIIAQTAMAEKEDLQLPDGSKIALNASSKVSYEESDERIVKLEGEAFFEVEKGVPFKVVTSNGIVTVLGTSFNVKSRGDQFEVDCKTGKVNVSIPEKAFDTDLLPGNKVITEADTVRKLTIDEAIIAKWQIGEFYFEAKPLDEVLDEIRRQFNVVIDADSTENKTFTGYFNNANLDLALTIVCEPLGLQYEILSDNKVIITNE